MHDNGTVTADGTTLDPDEIAGLKNDVSTEISVLRSIDYQVKQNKLDSLSGRIDSSIQRYEAAFSGRQTPPQIPQGTQFPGESN